MMTVRLSKSRYLAGIQCPKRLYLEIHARELAGEIDEGPRPSWTPGRGSGRSPGSGILAGSSWMWSISRWRRGWNARPRSSPIRVFPPSTRASSNNTAYLYPGGTLDLGQLFQEQDLTREVADRQTQIPNRLAAMRQILAAPAAPAVEPDDHCQDPYECPFWDYCIQDKPARWVYYLPGGRQAYRDLVALGVQTIDEIPLGFPLALLQRRVQENVEWVGPGLRAALDTVQYPVHHLDFETLGSAIPLYPNTRPYQAIPFQWSNHIETTDGELRHEAYLCPAERDPRQELAVALLKTLGKKGSICTYTGYERGVLTSLAEALPRLRRDLLRACDRLWDLHPIIKEHYYHPGFEGSFSIKYCERDTLAMVELRKALLAKVHR